MPLRKYRLRVAKAREQKERRITRLLEAYEVLAKGRDPTRVPDVVALEKLVAYHYPKLREQTRTEYAKILYSKLRQHQ